EICDNSDPVALEAWTDDAGYTTNDYRAYSVVSGSQFTSPNAIAETRPGVYEYDPSEIPYTINEPSTVQVRIEYNYLDKNGCEGTVSTFVWNDRKPTRPVGIDGTYCQFYEDPLYITATSEFKNLRWYDNSNLNPPILG